MTPTRSRHTPGPWLFVDDAFGVFVVSGGVGFSPPYRLAPGSGRCAQQAADACLIAAAPKMVEALQSVAARLRLRAEWYRTSDLAQRTFKAEADAGAMILESQIAVLEAAIAAALGDDAGGGA